MSKFDTLNFHRDDVDWTKINLAFEQYNWNLLFHDKSVNQMFDEFYSICFNVCAQHTPQKHFTKSTKKNKSQRKIYNYVRRRKRINKRLKNTTSPSKINKLNQELVEIEKALQLHYKITSEYNEEKAVHSIKTNPKFFYSYAVAVRSDTAHSLTTTRSKRIRLNLLKKIN